ncbi:relaxase/mobilization nuclease domain-containing protein [Parapedobacter sp. 2B3]|uniref:relaxase/mobilization nuclease domain-containing protein n=1 Tax=Parapedobacter sp. 2B3 TaxID=3342381 RepID=UPI0035B59A61
MVAKVISGKDIGGVLRYNEHKVEEGQAHLILASGFAGEIDQLNTAQKIQRFQHLTMLNARVKTNALHISLNFDPSEKPDDGTLQRIAMDYMERVGFGDQPFLVYRHLDAAHPHVHIATVNIRADGSRIDIHNIGRTLSEAARKEIEEKYQLVKAEGRTEKQGQGITAADPQKVTYGKSPTKHTITNIVNAVINNYSFTSIPELNAVLSQFNITADRGKEGTRMHQRGGLQYWITDTQGNKTGVPIKASSIYGKPTLANLETRFQKSNKRRQPHKNDLTERINQVLTAYNQLTRGTFTKELATFGIHSVFRESEQGTIYGITYVDNHHRTVFNGSDLGRAYTARGITAQLGQQDIRATPSANNTQQRKQHEQRPQRKTYLRPAPKPTDYLQKALKKLPTVSGTTGGKSLLESLLGRTGPEYGPFIPKRKKKKRRKRPDDQQGHSL